MFKDIVHSILKNYRETKRFFWEKPSKLKNLILLFSFAINDRINPLMLSALVRSVITAVNITERQMSFYPKWPVIWVLRKELMKFKKRKISYSSQSIFFLNSVKP